MFLAQASASGTGAIASMLIPLVIFFVLMYFMIMRPQKKEQQRVSSMLSSMEVGDSVVTTSGFYGTLIDITEEDVIVEFGNNKNCRIPMRKAAIAEVEKASDGIVEKYNGKTKIETKKQKQMLRAFSRWHLFF